MLKNLFGKLWSGSVDQPKDFSHLGFNTNNVQAILSHSVVSYRCNYLYVPLGKNANTQLKRYLWAVDNRSGYEVPLPEGYFDVHSHPEFLSGAKPSPWPCYADYEFTRFKGDARHRFLFSVVRNPYSRLLSAYLHIFNLPPETDVSEREKRVKTHGLPFFPESFADFVGIVSSQSDEITDVHWKSQCYTLMYDFFDYRYIGHFEDLPAVFARLETEFRVSGGSAIKPAEHETAASSRVSEYYTPELAEKLYDRYRCDFEAFGYSADYKMLISSAAVRPPRHVEAVAFQDPVAL